jgi:hypothetical protein
MRFSVRLHRAAGRLDSRRWSLRGGPGQSPTADLRVRSALLYATELPGHVVSVYRRSSVSRLQHIAVKLQGNCICNCAGPGSADGRAGGRCRSWEGLSPSVSELAGIRQFGCWSRSSSMPKRWHRVNELAPRSQQRSPDCACNLELSRISIGFNSLWTQQQHLATELLVQSNKSLPCSADAAREHHGATDWK